MELDEDGEQFIMGREGFKPESYLDISGVWTIGFGTTRINGAPVEPGMMINYKVGMALFHGRLENSIETVNDALRVQVNQNQFNALVSICYNIGEHNFLNSSLIRMVNNKLSIARDLFTRWNKITDPKTKKKRISEGLLNRRNAEYDLFMKAI